MVIKQGKMPYDISEFEKKAEKYFPNSEIYVGAKEGVDERIIQSFLDNVINYELEQAKLKEKQN